MSESPAIAQRPPIDPVLYASGPTGGGKSAVALALAKRLGSAAIINADAFQLYRGYEILSAAPGPRDQAEAPHFLYGVLPLTESCDAIRFAEMARAVIDDLIRQDIQPIVVGGSGLYLKALTHGLAPTPAGDADLRTQLDVLTLPELVAWYQRLDPEGAATTNLLNRRYVTRNLEISLLSGKPASELKREFVVPEPQLRAVVLTREREDLYERINQRTARMFQDGVVEEIRRLEHVPLSVTAEKAIGLAEIRAVIAGETDQNSAIEQIRQSTRHYAKRQLTWFRREKAFQSVCLDASETAGSAADRILTMFPELRIPASPR